MKFKIASAILGLYSAIGLGLVFVLDFEKLESFFISFILFVFIPALGCYGTIKKKRLPIFITILFFVSQSIEFVGDYSLIPHFSPITISVPYGDFSKGEGYLVDYFAIFIAFYLAWLFKLLFPSQNSTQE